MRSSTRPTSLMPSWCRWAAMCPNPLALLTNSHFAELLDMLSRMADYVIVDAPPVGVVIDAAEIAKACDGTLIAVNYNDVSRQGAAGREAANRADRLPHSGHRAQSGGLRQLYGPQVLQILLKVWKVRLLQKVL